MTIIRLRLCGHTESVWVSRLSRRAGRAAAFLKGPWLCKTCNERERFLRWIAAAESNKARGLPPLVGSARQVQWAEWIRDKVFNMTAGEARECFEKTSALWWILGYRSFRWSRAAAAVPTYPST
jgi:hypothetical protein